MFPESSLKPNLKYMKKPKLYIPGLLSLLLLFPLLINQLSQWHIFERDHVLEVAWFSPTQKNGYGQGFPPAKKYAVINLTGNSTHDSIKIEYTKVLLHEMIAQF
jgi:hypothetical protein